MKKIICLLLIVFCFTNSAFAYGSANMDDFSTYKSKYRILYGIILLVGGGVLAYDGFRNVKIDISNPDYKITGSGSWNDNTGMPGMISLQSAGTITNTGNVTYKMVAFDVRYIGGGNNTPIYYYPNPGLGSQGYQVKFENAAGVYYSLAPGQTISWADAIHNELIAQNAGQFPNGDPGTVYTYPELKDNINLIGFTGTGSDKWGYERKYKKEMNNVYEGVAGVLLAGVGAYILIDYLVGLKKFDYYMKKNDMNFYVTNSYDEFKLMLAKRI